MTVQEDKSRVKAALLDLYTEEQAEEFLTSPQKLLNGERPIDVIWDGRADDVLDLIKCAVEGVYT